MGKHDNPPLDRLSIVEPNRLEYIDRISNYGDVTVLVDNSVKSVRTLGNVVQKLKANGIQVTYLLKLVDYQDRLEEELGEHLHSEFGIRLSNVFFITDLLSDLTPEARDLVRRHLELSGGSR
jgi:orotate phosphoribosyltransferase